MNDEVFHDYDIILHIGMQRTGTTFLQENIYKKFKDINYIGPEKKEFFNSFFKIDEEKHKNRILNNLSKEKTNLISEENINCSMFSKKDSRYKRLSMLNKYFSNARILFGIRSKDELLVSWYIKYIMVGGIYSYNDFLKKIMNNEKINYENYLEKLKQLWGNDKIFIYHFDTLKTNPDKFVNEITTFIGEEVKYYQNIKRNRGYSLNQVKISLYLNRIFKSKHNPKGLIPLHYLYYPHRILFQSRFFSMFPKNKITIHDLKQL